MLRPISLFLLVVFLSAGAHADLRDLRAQAGGDSGQIWLGFDAQPASVETELLPAGVRLVITGVTVEGRTISPAHGELVGGVSIEPTPAGAVITMMGSRGWESADAQIYAGGVLVSVGLTDTILQPEPMPERVPESTPETPVAQTVEAVREPDVEPAYDILAEAGTEAVQDTADDTPLTAPAEEAAPAPVASAAGTSERVEGCAAAAAAVEANPWDDARLFEHAGCLAATGQEDAASAIYEQILAFEPENVTAAIALAELRESEGDPDAARALYQQAARYARSDAEAARARARIRALREP